MENARKYAILLALSILLLLCSCQKRAQYTDILSALEVTEEALSGIETTSLRSVEIGYLDDYISIPDTEIDHEIRIASDGNNLDEIGVWHVSAGDAERLRMLLEEYLSRSLERNRTFYDSYIPHETAKLRDAEVRVFGTYVAYAIMNDADRAAFFEAVEQTLRQ